MIFFINISNGQHDTSQIYNSSQLKKGFYKTYQEYLNNAPSITPSDATIIYLIKTRRDSTIVAARYKINDYDVKKTDIWGFCDGYDVFIKKRISPFKKRCLKSEYIGKHPFVLSWHKNVFAVGPPLFALATAAATAAMPATFDLFFINADGNIKQASYRNLKKLFAADPDLLKRFKADNYISDKTKIQYLVEFNEQYLIAAEK